MKRASFVFLFAVGLVLPSSVGWAQQATGESELLSRVTDRYAAYAPSAGELETVVAGLERADHQFTRYMGEAPPKVGFVLYETEAQRSAHTEDDLGMPVYAISNRRPGRLRITMFPELGFVLDGDHDRPAVVRATYQGDVPDLGLQQGDEIIGVNGRATATLRELIAARQTWEPGQEIELEIEREGAVQTERLTFPGRGGPAAPPSGAMARAMAFTPARSPDTSFVAHEAAHRMVSARYGSVGSWFQEGFASLMELPADADRRRSAMLEQSENAIPWARFLTMPHPAAEAEGRARFQSGQPGPVAISVEDGVGLFYSQGLMVLEYVLDVGGPEGIVRLARWLSEGRPAAAFPLPLEGDNQATLIDHEAAWHEWLDRR